MNTGAQTQTFLIIKTNSYVGNFERELTEYVFGFGTQYGNDDFTQESRKEIGEDISEKLCQKIDPYVDEEHGPGCGEIDGDSNNLIIRFIEDPTDAEWELIYDRLTKFPAALQKRNSKYGGKPKKIKIKGVDVFKAHTVYTADLTRTRAFFT